MRVLVTGARGFVGRRLVPRLEAAEHSVSACDSELDVTDPGGLARHWRHFAPEAVVHLAALSSVASSYDDAAAGFQKIVAVQPNNTTALKGLLEIYRANSDEDNRLATVQRADEIMILEQGRIREHGPRARLAADANSRFSQLLQTGLEEAFA